MIPEAHRYSRIYIRSPMGNHVGADCGGSFLFCLQYGQLGHGSSVAICGYFNQDLGSYCVTMHSVCRHIDSDHRAYTAHEMTCDRTNFLVLNGEPSSLSDHLYHKTRRIDLNDMTKALSRHLHKGSLLSYSLAVRLVLYYVLRWVCNNHLSPKR